MSVLPYRGSLIVLKTQLVTLLTFPNPRRWCWRGWLWLTKTRELKVGRGERLSVQVWTIMMMYWLFLEQQPPKSEYENPEWCCFGNLCVAVPGIKHGVFVYNLIWIFVFRRAALYGNRRSPISWLSCICTVTVVLTMISNYYAFLGNCCPKQILSPQTICSILQSRRALWTRVGWMEDFFCVHYRRRLPAGFLAPQLLLYEAAEAKQREQRRQRVWRCLVCWYLFLHHSWVVPFLWCLASRASLGVFVSFTLRHCLFLTFFSFYPLQPHTPFNQTHVTWTSENHLLTRMSSLGPVSSYSRAFSHITLSSTTGRVDSRTRSP